MTNNDLQAELNRLLPGEEPQVADAREKALTDYLDHQRKDGSFAIRALNLTGGLIATITLIGFMALGGLFDSRLSIFVVGLLLSGGAFMLNRSKAGLLAEAFTVALSVTGAILLLVALDYDSVNEQMICLAGAVLSLLYLAIIENKIVAFLATLATGFSLLSFTILAEWHFFIHLFLAAHALLLAIFFLRESHFLTLSPALTRRYLPMRAGLSISFLIAAVYLGKQFWWSEEVLEQHYVASCVIIPLVLFVAYGQLKKFKVVGTKKWLYLGGLTLLLLPTIFAPAIAAALLLLLLAFVVGSRILTVIAAAAMIYLIGQYYYDLHLTLFTKSMVLMASGVLLLLAYGFLHPKLVNHEDAH